MARHFGSVRSRHVDRKWSKKPRDPKLAALRLRARIRGKDADRRANSGKDGVKFTHYTSTHSDAFRNRGTPVNLARSQFVAALSLLFWIALIGGVIALPFVYHQMGLPSYYPK